MTECGMQAIVEAALGDFGSKNVVEVSEVEIAAGRPAHILELWHGRTLAFKDLGLQVCIEHWLKKLCTDGDGAQPNVRLLPKLHSFCTDGKRWN
jgi:threonine synthase